MKQPDERLSDRIVLLVISVGLIAIIMSIVWGLFLNPRTMPNWAENVLVSVATACALKLGDCLSTLVALSSGRQVERLGTQLASSAPPSKPAPEDAKEAAEQVAGAATDEAEQIAGEQP